MAIRIRRGNQADFDANKLVAGELGVVLDRGELYFCYSPGNVKKLQTAEDLQDLLNASPEAYTALQYLIQDLKKNPNALINILNNISSLNNNKLDKTGDSKDNVTTFAEATEDEDIQSGESHSTLFGKIKKSIKTLRYNIGLLTSQKLDVDKIVQTDTINDPTRVPASTVTYAHGQSIAQLNNNLAVQNVLDKIIPNSGITFSTASYAKRIGNRISIYLNVTGYTAQANTLIPIATVDSSIWPASFVVGFGLATDHNAQNNVLVRAVISGGTLSISMPTVQSYTNIWFDYYI